MSDEANGRGTSDAKDAEDFARWIVRNDVETGDHACAQCWPGGEIVIAGFVCVYHRALAVSRGTNSASPWSGCEKCGETEGQTSRGDYCEGAPEGHAPTHSFAGRTTSASDNGVLFPDQEKRARLAEERFNRLDADLRAELRIGPIDDTWAAIAKLRDNATIGIRASLREAKDKLLGVCPSEAKPSLEDYRNAPSGIGPLADVWKDKPHRLVYDLIKLAERSTAEAKPRDWNARHINEPSPRPRVVSVLRNLLSDAVGGPHSLTENHGSVIDARNFLRDGGVEGLSTDYDQAEGIAEARRNALDEERANIVAWLRDDVATAADAASDPHLAFIASDLANHIEAGAHVPTQKRSVDTEKKQ